ncbi:conserved hypothetical protein [Leishmania infantum JPCM5]|uniref:Uncharacterized protein n=2 Tax=Leishmania infantum TaxID=5671 RepID=A4I753_LEIIN|nr:conserved hypothetical protein [Leishmania infantum JPCM5]CAC9520891.1 hypothetical_protein_-_conserved [Leishmania infantum]CAM70632.1 conserved hypothetical protein [Leishmania infantum JPCM5]SUZ44482.1 hypothetical_protein_-_conserved [Leishmania infantum]|eukprot:XP_001467572.1 conserved hypothetical protein [Leishmania infantum JPCM5]
MLVTPVEKPCRYAPHSSLRFLCVEPATRMAYLSGKGTRVWEWKHRMTVYAIMPKCVEASHAMNHRAWNVEVSDVLIMTISGVAYSRLDRSDPESEAELQRLPKLLSERYKSSDPTTGVYVGRQEISSSSERSVNNKDDENFFGRGREDWKLQCYYYSAMHNVVTLAVDTLIRDGLRFPLHGGLRTGVDPRNGLRLASFPLYLQPAFHQLAVAVVYTCIYGRMMGCDPRGRVGIYISHVYSCITERDILFVAENGAVARSLPLSLMEAVEYNGPLARGTSDTGAATTSTPLPPTEPSMPYAAFLTSGESADVLFIPCSAFLDECNDCSASMASAMPQISVGTEMRNALHVLRTLSSNSLQGANSSEGCENECSAPRHEEADCANYLDGCPDSVFSDPHAPAAPPLKPDGLAFVTLPSQQSLRDYVDGFQATHRRAFKWQPLPGNRQLTPALQSAAPVAHSLGLRAPSRQAITCRTEFLPFYYGSEVAAKAARRAAEPV